MTILAAKVKAHLKCNLIADTQKFYLFAHSDQANNYIIIIPTAKSKYIHSIQIRLKLIWTKFSQ